MSKTTNINTGLGFIGALTLVFIHAKITGGIDWSWWYVMMPLYILPAILLVGFGLAVAGKKIWNIIKRPPKVH